MFVGIFVMLRNARSRMRGRMAVYSYQTGAPVALFDPAVSILDQAARRLGEPV